MTSARSLGVLALLVSAFGWGLGWPLMKLVLHTWTPLWARGVAGIVAAILLAAAARAQGESLALPAGSFPRLALAAFTNVFAWMGFSTLCLRWLSVGEGTLLVYTMPIWATLFTWLRLKTAPTPRAVAALVLGLAGVSVLLGAHGPGLGVDRLLGIAFALGAGSLFALGAVLNREAVPLPPVALTAWQVGLGCVPMAAIGLAVERPDILALDATGFWAMVYMTIVGMGICYLAWFEALRRLPPAAASTSMLLVPLTGMLFASRLLGEPIGGREVLAMALTLGGVALALRKS